MNFAELLQQDYTRRMQNAPPAERAFREKAWGKYLQLGLPTRKSEAWKYSSLAKLDSTAWREAAASVTLPASVREVIAPYRSQFDVAVLVNGELQSEGLSPSSIYQLSTEREWTGEYEDGLSNALAATHQTGYSLHVKAQSQSVRPLLLVHFLQGDSEWSSTLNSITLEEGARFELLEIFVGEHKGLRTGLTQATLAKNSILQWARLQEEAENNYHFADLRAHLSEAARLDFHQIHAGACWARSSLAVALHGQNAETHIHGLTFARGDHHVDQRIEANHLVANTSSSQLFKGVLKDRSRGVLNGKIHIARQAQKVVSSQLNHNLLLNDGAEADTKPELEIFADDVKANHGASVGRLDEDKIFYLQSRGISRAVARQLLANAFVGDVLLKIPKGVMREFLSSRVNGILGHYSREMESLQ